MNFKNRPILVKVLVCLVLICFSKHMFGQACSYEDYNYSDFYHGWGIWNDGGSDCSREAEYGGFLGLSIVDYQVAIWDNNGSSSSTYTDVIDGTNVESIQVDFAYEGSGLENGESFYLEYSVDGGASFHTVKQWICGSDFSNHVPYLESTTFSHPFTNSTVLRFRANTSGWLLDLSPDKVLFEHIKIKTCTPTVLTYGYCDITSQSDFEAGTDIWIDGGNNCEVYPDGANGSGYSLRLRDDDGSESSTYSTVLDFSGINEVTVDFMLKFDDMESHEDLLLEYSTDGGSSYQVAGQWIQGVNFANGGFEYQFVRILDNFTSNTVLRFRCDASSTHDYAFIDDIKVVTCEPDPYAGVRPKYRTIDGSLNNFDNMDWGTVNSPLVRALPSEYGDGSGSMGGIYRPSPRHISNQLSDEPQDRRDERLLSGMAYQFGQFLDHDFVLVPGGPDFQPISVPDYDPVFTPYGIIPFTRSAAIPGLPTREQINEITSYIDASHIYGSSPARAAWLRSYQDGKLKVSNGNLLPYNTVDGEYESPIDYAAPRMERDELPDGTRLKLFVAGDFRANEHPNLTALHTIFVREHNRLCDIIKSNGVTVPVDDSGMTDDDWIYEKARKIVGALMQQIAYEEFLPAFGVELDEYYGYNAQVNPGIRNVFSVAAYRWHTMVENDIIMRNDACEGIGGVELPLKTIFNNPDVIKAFGPGVLLRGLSFHPQYRTDIKVNNGLRNFLFGPGTGLDLVSINIQRGRDHGLPDYKTVRSHYGLGEISSFSDISSDYDATSKLQMVYGDIDEIDLWPGIYSEPLVSGTSLPATAIAIVKEQFEALRDGDYYFYKNDKHLSDWDWGIIQSSNLANIIERNSSARSMPYDIFFKPPCDDSDPLEDLNDHEGKAVCNAFNAATFYNNCTSASGVVRGVGHYTSVPYLKRIDVELGYAVRVHHDNGDVMYFTDDAGCLPTSWHNKVSSVEVVCLSDDPSTVFCSSFAGALFATCGGSPMPITTTGDYTSEQLQSLGVIDDDVDAIRVNDGFKVTLYRNDYFSGGKKSFYGPTVVCLPDFVKNQVSSMKVVCLTEPDRSNCAQNGIAGAVFPDTSSEKSHIGVSVGVGDYDRARLIDLCDIAEDIEKVQVNNGYAITLFDLDNFGGFYTTHVGDTSDLGYLHNDVSSMKVACIENLTSARLIDEELLSFEAEKEASMARLEVNYNLAKEVKHQTIEKFNGKTGEFELLEKFAAFDNQGTLSTFDENPLPGDNIYRVKVYYLDGTEEETPYRVVNFGNEVDFTAFPNPAVDVINVTLTGTDEAIVYLYDILGKEIFSQQANSSNLVTFDVSDQSEGTYIVRVVTNNQKVSSKKVTVLK